MVGNSSLSEKDFILKYLPNGFIYDDTLFGIIHTPEILEKSKHFEFRSTDIIVSSYPKSGIF
jgi:hypothetical protein